MTIFRIIVETGEARRCKKTKQSHWDEAYKSECPVMEKTKKKEREEEHSEEEEEKNQEKTFFVDF